jgi:glutaminase
MAKLSSQTQKIITESIKCFTPNSTNIRCENLTSRTKIMAFKGTEPIRSKIVIDNMILEQVNTFIYLGCNITY